MSKNHSSKHRSGRRPSAGGGERESSRVLLPGRKALSELAKYRPQAIKKIYSLDALKAPDEFLAVLEGLRRDGVPIETMNRDRLDTLLPESAHQGIIAEIDPLTPISLAELIVRAKKGNQLILALDEIQDPQNLGAFLRLADASGVDGILISENRSAGLSATVRKISAGASEFVPVAHVSNLATALRQLKTSEFWIVGAALSAESKPLYETDISGPVVLVIGSEGKGLRPLVLSLCDYQVSIPMKGRLQSLNASHAAAVILYEFERRKHS